MSPEKTAEQADKCQKECQLGLTLRLCSKCSAAELPVTGVDQTIACLVVQ